MVDTSKLRSVRTGFNDVADVIDEIPSHEHSTSETLIGTLNGKDLYSKVVNTGALPNAAYNDRPHGIVGAFTGVSISGFTKSGGFQLSLNSTIPGNTIASYFISDQFRILTNFNAPAEGYGATDALLIYTKP